MESHWGTHVDAPRHFFINGRSVADYPAVNWVFTSPKIIDIDLEASGILREGKWIDKIKESTDIILFRAGWSRFRKTDKYMYDNPGIGPEVGLKLRRRFLNLRAVGIDWISISPYRNRELGRQTHKAFLDPGGENGPVLLVEDMDLSGEMTGLQSLIILPLIISGIDSAPSTVLGVFND
jgi:kynurenine formamidase